MRPMVATASQPWALGRNPVGIDPCGMVLFHSAVLERSSEGYRERRENCGPIERTSRSPKLKLAIGGVVSIS